MTIRDRAAKLLLGNKVQQLEKMTEAFFLAYQEGPYILPPEQLLSQLQEYDDALVMDLIHQLQWERVSGYGEVAENERKRAVDDSKRMWRYSILAQWIVKLWTAYGMGESIKVIPEDTKAQAVWDEFWTADRNQPVLAEEKLHELSRWLLVKGERFLVFYASEQDGKTTVRLIQPEEITEIVTDPDDSTVPLYYKREWQEKTVTASGSKTLYYADWAASAKDLKRAKLPNGAEVASRNQTEVVVLHVPFEQKEEESLRGWPLLAPAGTPWIRAQREFMENRATVTRAKASYVRRRVTKGGSRAVESVKAVLASSLQYGGATETNPPPVAGSEDIHNEAIRTTDLSMATGAGDAKVDNEAFAWTAGLAGGLFPHYMGLGDAYRLATATAMEKPLELQFSLYRKRLSGLFRRMARIVLQFAEVHGNSSFKSYEVEVSTDRLVAVDLAQTSESLSKVWGNIVIPLLTAGKISDDVLSPFLSSTLVTIAQALGVEPAPYEKIVVPEGEPEEPREEPEEAEIAELLPPWEGPVVITDEDIEAALEWLEDLDPEIADLVKADEVEARGE